MAKARRVKLRRVGDRYQVWMGNNMLNEMCLDWEKVTDYRLSPGEEVQIKLNVEVIGKVHRTRYKKPPQGQPLPPLRSDAVSAFDRLAQRLNTSAAIASMREVPNRQQFNLQQYHEAIGHTRDPSREAERMVRDIPDPALRQIFEEAQERHPPLRTMSLREFVGRYPGQIVYEYQGNRDYDSFRQRERERQRVDQYTQGYTQPRRSRRGRNNGF